MRDLFVGERYYCQGSRVGARDDDFFGFGGYERVLLRNVRFVSDRTPRGARKREGYGGPTAAGGGVRSCVARRPHSKHGHPGGARPRGVRLLADPRGARPYQI